MPIDFSRPSFHQISEDHLHQRIDNFLFTLLKGVPKSMIYKLIRKGELRVNKGRVQASYKLKLGDIVRLPPIRVAEPQQLPDLNKLVKTNNLQVIEEAIIYEDPYIMVINKPSGIAVHGGSGLSFGIIEALRALRPQFKFLELVHRIDKDTSGILLIAKKRNSLIILQNQLRNKQMRKNYYALVNGIWNKKQVDLPLLRVLMGDERFVKVSKEGKDSITLFEVVEQFAMATLIVAKPITGRTHQIRVHCLSQGSAIAGDVKYDQAHLKFWHENKLNRLFLHAYKLEFSHPQSKEKMQFIAPLSKELELVLNHLRQ